MMVGEELPRAQVSRILHSETFRTSEVLRRLLKFLADKSLSGEADQLKEYTIGIDAMGKPPEYDPRQDSVVRIQVGRLRQKLAEYYRSEGKDDPVLIDLPKGHFRLSWEERPKPEPLHSAPLELIEHSPAPPKPNSRRRDWILAAALVLTAIWAIYCTVQLRRARSAATQASIQLTPEVKELWRPMLSTSRPLIISPAASLFVGLQGSGFYRDPSLNRWEDVLASPEIEKMRKALNNPEILPVYRFTGYGTMTALFRVGRLLGLGGPNPSIVRGDQLSWQQLVDNNVLFLGPPRLNAEQLRSLPVELEFDLDAEGLRDRHPKAGEPALLADRFPGIRKATEKVGGTDNGEAYALITHTPGPFGVGDIECFNSNLSVGTMAAVEAFTAPALAETIVGKLRKSDGKLPAYYQIVLDVKFKDGVPTEIRYVTHRELHAEARRAG